MDKTRYTLYDALQEKAGVRRPALEEEDREMAFVAELTAHGDRYKTTIGAKDARIERLTMVISNVLAQLKFAHGEKPEKATIKNVRALHLACCEAHAVIKEPT